MNPRKSGKIIYPCIMFLLFLCFTLLLEFQYFLAIFHCTNVWFWQLYYMETLADGLKAKYFDTGQCEGNYIYKKIHYQMSIPLAWRHLISRDVLNSNFSFASQISFKFDFKCFAWETIAVLNIYRNPASFDFSTLSLYIVFYIQCSCDL